MTSISLPGVAHSMLQPCTICRTECPNWVPPYMTTALTQVLQIREMPFSSYLEIIHLFLTLYEIRPIKEKTFNYLKYIKFHWERKVYNVKRQIKQIRKDYFIICLIKWLLTMRNTSILLPLQSSTHKTTQTAMVSSPLAPVQEHSQVLCKLPAGRKLPSQYLLDSSMA